MRFPSKIDVWFVVIVLGTLLLVIFDGLQSIFSNMTSWEESLKIFIVQLGIPCFLLWLSSSTYYIIGEDKLVIKFGPFRKIIPLAEIKRVRKSMNPIASPALSLKRLEILYGDHNSVLISPKNQEEFLDLLRKRCPMAYIEP
ncbi:PH domain-containing protein [Bacillaceae bacterium]